MAGVEQGAVAATLPEPAQVWGPGPSGLGELSGEAPDPGEGSALLAAIDSLGEDVGAVAALVDWRERDVAVLAAVGRLARVRTALEAVHLSLVREVTTRGVAETSPVATSPEGFLRSATLVDAATARRDTQAAGATAPGEPLARFADELTAGRVSRAHLDRAVRCLSQLPRHVLDQPGAAEQVVDYLLTAAVDASPRELDRAARQLLARLVPEREDRLDPHAHERRTLDLHTDDTGMVIGRFQLDPVAGASLRAAIDRWSAPSTGTFTGRAALPPTDPTTDPASRPARGRAVDSASDCDGEPAGGSGAGTEGTPDRRSAGQRRADALATIAHAALAVAEPRRAERPRVVLTLTPQQLVSPTEGRGHLEGGEPVPTWAARRIACDAVLERVLVTDSLGPLDVARGSRLATLAQRRALAVRDGGCVIPGCAASPAMCDAHHITHWADGGRTDLANLVLLCPGHHTAVHVGTWEVSCRRRGPDVTVMVTPPGWIDALRRARPAPRQRGARLANELHAGLHGGERYPDGTPAPWESPSTAAKTTARAAVPAVPSPRPARSAPVPAQEPLVATSKARSRHELATTSNRPPPRTDHRLEPTTASNRRAPRTDQHPEPTTASNRPPPRADP